MTEIEDVTPDPRRRDVCQLFFAVSGEQRSWRISAARKRDTEARLKAHLRHHVPGAEWLGYRWEQSIEATTGDAD